MWYTSERVLLLSVSLVYLGKCELNPFVDNIYFTINWRQASQETGEQKLSEPLTDENSLVITTNNNEKYRCELPNGANRAKSDDIDSYSGPSELELLAPLFKLTSCSYRIESYWTYELCHGRFLRQYHESKESGKKAHIQEYFLGYYKTEKTEAGTESVETPAETVEITSETKKHVVPKLRIDNVEFPYYAVTFTEGTVCDVSGTPRKATLKYICQHDGKGEIYELKETSSCEYDLIILTSYICGHPSYQLKEKPVNDINCEPLDGSPTRPKNLDILELENTIGRYNKKEQAHDGIKVDTKEKEIIDSRTGLSSTVDKQLLKDFLSGEYCLSGGTGWWHHEFCYGKHVVQFHEDKDGKTTILLGTWDGAKHVTWLSENPNKKPKPKGERKHISLFYSNGDICDITKKPRKVEVKLKCPVKPSSSHAVSIYLVEPNVCEYILVIESPILCDIIDQADENGIVQS